MSRHRREYVPTFNPWRAIGYVVLVGLAALGALVGLVALVALGAS